MSALWTVISFGGLAFGAYWLARQATASRGQPTSETSVGADLPPEIGPGLRQYLGALIAKLRAKNLGPDTVAIDWRTVYLMYKDRNAEAIVLAAALLPEGSVDLDGKFYRFNTKTIEPKIKTPEWASDAEE